MGYKTVKGHGIMLYPESAPTNWQDVITSIGVPVAWALHDKDVDKNNNPVKPHIHIYFFKPLTKKLQSYLSKSLKDDGVLYFENMYDLYSTYHYLWHDTPDAKKKYKYDKSIVRTSDDFYEDDYPKTFETEDIANLLFKIIRDYGFTEITQLLELIADNEIDFDGISAREIRKYVSEKSYYVNTILTSYREQKGVGNDNSRNISHR